MLLFQTLLFTALVPGTVLVLVPQRLMANNFDPWPFDLGGLHWLGLAPLVLGVVAFLWCSWDFLVRGQGTPAPVAPPQNLVSHGLYRWVRNPMYVGVLGILIGEAMLFSCSGILLYALGMLCLFHLHVVFREEPDLRRRHGQPYASYLLARNRWLPRRPTQNL